MVLDFGVRSHFPEELGGFLDILVRIDGFLANLGPVAGKLRNFEDEIYFFDVQLLGLHLLYLIQKEEAIRLPYLEVDVVEHFNDRGLALQISFADSPPNLVQLLFTGHPALKQHFEGVFRFLDQGGVPLEHGGEYPLVFDPLNYLLIG